MLKKIRTIRYRSMVLADAEPALLESQPVNQSQSSGMSAFTSDEAATSSARTLRACAAVNSFRRFSEAPMQDNLHAALRSVSWCLKSLPV
jgi:hypothetical protein